MEKFLNESKNKLKSRNIYIKDFCDFTLNLFTLKINDFKIKIIEEFGLFFF